MTATTTTSPRQDVISCIQHERGLTRRVLDAFPASSSELKPHPTSATAREVAHTICTNAEVSIRAVDGTLDMSKLDTLSKVPETWAEVITAFEGSHDILLKALEGVPDQTMAMNMKFMTGPKQMGELSRLDIVRMMINDQIHHRGQLSVYLRMTGSRVPSIYGPSKDEPWN